MSSSSFHSGNMNTKSRVTPFTPHVKPFIWCSWDHLERALLQTELLYPQSSCHAGWRNSSERSPHLIVLYHPPRSQHGLRDTVALHIGSVLLCLGRSDVVVMANAGCHNFNPFPYHFINTALVCRVEEEDKYWTLCKWPKSRCTSCWVLNPALPVCPRPLWLN